MRWFCLCFRIREVTIQNKLPYFFHFVVIWPSYRSMITLFEWGICCCCFSWIQKNLYYIDLTSAIFTPALISPVKKFGLPPLWAAFYAVQNKICHFCRKLEKCVTISQNCMWCAKIYLTNWLSTKNLLRNG